MMVSLYSMVIQWSEEDEVFVVSLPEFGPYSTTHGSPYEEAAKNGRVVPEALIDTYREEGRHLPEPAMLGSSVSQADGPI